MEKDQVLAELTAERLDLCDYLEQLDEDAWSTTSLCAGWTVHEVVAHLVLNTEQTTLEFIKGLIRARGNFDRMSLEQAQARAAIAAPVELVRQLRESAGSNRRAPGSSPFDPLLDVIVHGQDIARAVHRDRPVQKDRAIAGIERAVGTSFYGAKKRLAGLRLIATDADWTNGKGDSELVGPIADLILVATGRPAGIANLTGAGVAIVTQRL